MHCVPQSLGEDDNGMGQLHFAAIGDETGKIEWLVPAHLARAAGAFARSACVPHADACVPSDALSDAEFGSCRAVMR